MARHDILLGPNHAQIHHDMYKPKSSICFCAPKNRERERQSVPACQFGARSRHQTLHMAKNKIAARKQELLLT